MGWLAGYAYRKKIPITGQAGAGTGYQVELEVHPGLGADAAGVVHLINHCQDFPNDIRFTDGDGVTELDHWLEDPGVHDYLAADGIRQPINYTAYPAAAYYNNKTYVVWQAGTGFDPYIIYYDHSSGEWSQAYQVASNPLSADDHGAPCVLIDNNGYVHVFYGCHNSALKHAKSNSPEDISAFTVQANVTSNASYPKPIRDGNDIYMFYRKSAGGAAYPECYRKSPDNGSTWGAENTIINSPAAGGRVYVGHVERTGSEIHLAWCYASNGVDRYNIYHAYLNTSDGKMYAMDGTDLGTTITEAEANTDCKVVDSGADDASFPSLHLDASGFPWLIYVKGSGVSFDFYHTRWNGAAWTAPVSITSTDHLQNYSDFIINSTTDVVAYLTTSGQAGWGGDIQKWTWNGAAWGSGGTILSEATSGKQLNGPIVPFNFQSSLELVFCQNDVSFLMANLKVYAHDGSAFVKRTLEATVWIEVADNLDSNQDIYIYYGKSAVASASDGDATFLFFDDFRGAANWTSTDEPDFQIDTVNGELDFKALRNTTDQRIYRSDKQLAESQYWMEFIIEQIGRNGDDAHFWFGFYETNENLSNKPKFAGFYLMTAAAGDRFGLAKCDGVGFTLVDHHVGIQDAEYTVQIYRSGTTTHLKLFEGAIERLSASTTLIYAPTYLLGSGFDDNFAPANWVQGNILPPLFVRKYNDPEPVVGTAGGEETTLPSPMAPAYGLDPMIF